MERRWWMGLAGTGAIVAACASPKTPNDASSAFDPIPEPAVREATFEEDVEFLAQHGGVETLTRPNGGRIAVSTKYQGCVMTSAVIPGGVSLGFVHRAFIEGGKTGTKFDNYGGEDRFWLGPEGGKFGLFFESGKPFTFDEWQTPHAIQEGDWTVVKHNPESIELTHAIQVTNASGTTFDVDVVRTVTLLGESELRSRLGLAPTPDLAWVAFETSNRIVNAGAVPWTEDKGLLSIWILGMFAPAIDTRIVIPLDPEGSGPMVKDDYFEKVPPERLRTTPSYAIFTADGALRTKIGVGPGRARSIVGSYSEAKGLLTIVQFNRQYGTTQYVNSAWETQTNPYGGDVINAYNDGPTGPGKPSLGGFFELETSSPAEKLAPGASAVHLHRTIHFTGTKLALDPLARKLLGVSLDEITK